MGEELKKMLCDFDREITTKGIPQWSALPELELYMDQVIILLNQYLGSIQSGDSEVVTKNMINNYVKMKVVPAPVRKKYSRIHIAYLILVCIMKKIYSIAMIKTILPPHELCSDEEIEAFYDDFVASFYEAEKEDVKHYLEYAENNDCIIKLSAEAVVLKTMAEKLVSE